MTSSAEAHEIQFKNPVFNTGLNVTVRNGDKWHNRCNPGDPVEVVQTGKEEQKITDGYILCTHLIENWRNIPSCWLQFEHDPSCTNLDGLEVAMDHAYGTGKWGPNVTVVMIILKKAHKCFVCKKRGATKSLGNTSDRQVYAHPDCFDLVVREKWQLE